MLNYMLHVGVVRGGGGGGGGQYRLTACFETCTTQIQGPFIEQQKFIVEFPNLYKKYYMYMYVYIFNLFCTS